mgnify:CR=1 FL=1
MHPTAGTLKSWAKENSKDVIKTKVSTVGKILINTYSRFNLLIFLFLCMSS